MPDPLLTVDGRERRPEEIMIIAATPALLKRQPGQTYHEMHCRACGTRVLGDDNTLARYRLGCFVFCPECGVARNPGVHAGYDRDTGQPLTVSDFVRRPDLRGAFR